MSKGTAIVTGGARGIGFSITRRLAKDGFRVVAVDVLEEVLAKSVDELRTQGLEVRGHVVDLSDVAAIRAIPAKLGADFDALKVLVNNAGISPKQDGRKVMFDAMKLEHWELVMRINLTAPFLLSQLAIGPMRKNGGGRIINTSSRAARMPSGVAGTDYVVSKSGLAGLTKAIALELAGDGITVNAVAPGTVEGPMMQRNSPDVRARILSGIPLGRLASPDEIAGVVSFLAGPDAAYITGATIDVNGGVVVL